MPQTIASLLKCRKSVANCNLSLPHRKVQVWLNTFWPNFTLAASWLSLQWSLNKPDMNALAPYLERHFIIMNKIVKRTVYIPYQQHECNPNGISGYPRILSLLALALYAPHHSAHMNHILRTSLALVILLDINTNRF